MSMETGSVKNGIPKYPLACYIVGLSLVGYLSIAVIVILIVHLNMIIYLATLLSQRLVNHKL